MSLLRFKVFQPIIFKIATFFSILLSAFLYAGNADSADVTLAWDGVSQSGVTVTGYRVYYRTESSSDLTKGCEVDEHELHGIRTRRRGNIPFCRPAYNSYGESEPFRPGFLHRAGCLANIHDYGIGREYGSISPSGTFSLTEGQSKNFKISPHSGFHIHGRAGGRKGHRSFF